MHIRPIHAIVPSLLVACLAAEEVVTAPAAAAEATPAPAPAPEAPAALAPAAAAASKQLAVSAGLLFQAFRNAGEDYAIVDKGTAGTNSGPIDQSAQDRGLGFALGLTWKGAEGACSYAIEVSRLQSDEERSVSDPGQEISATQTHAEFQVDIAFQDIGRAYARVDTDMLRASLLVGADGRSDSGLEYGYRGGLTMMRFENNRTYQYFENDTPTPGEDHVVVARGQEFTGYGVTVDGSLRKRLGESFSVFGAGGLSLLAGTSDISFLETEPDDGQTHNDVTNSIDHTVMVFKLAVGLGWQKRLSNGDLSIDVSYELESFQGLKRDVKFTDDVTESTTTPIADDIGIDGFKLNVGYAF